MKAEFTPSLNDVKSLKVGDMVVNCFGKTMRVTSIIARDFDTDGKMFVVFEQMSGTGSGRMSNSYKEGRKYCFVNN